MLLSESIQFLLFMYKLKPLGYPCSQRKIKFKSVAEREKSRFLAVGVPVAAAYPNVKVVSKWEVKDPSNPHAPPLFCVYIPFAVLK